MSYRDRYPAPGPPCRRCGADLAPDARFCPECGLAAPPLVELHPADPHAGRMPSWLMPAGVVFGGLAALGLGIFLALAMSGPDAVAGASPTPTVSPTALASALAPPTTPAASSSLAPSPTPVPLGVIPNRAIAVVTEEGDGLHLRDAGKLASDSLGTLSSGARVFIIGAPVAGEGYAWYRVAWVDGPLESGCVDACQRIGWVATPPSGEPWLEEAEVACGTPTTIHEIDALLPLERLSCFGSQDLTLTGPVEAWGVTGCVFAPEYSPAWLIGSGCGGGVRFAGTTGPPIDFITAPESGLAEPPTPAGIRFIGHFEDPAAPSCRLVDPGEVIGAPSGAALVLHCRTILVITDYEVIAVP